MTRYLLPLLAAAAAAVPTLAHAGFGTNGTTCNHATFQAAVNALPSGGTIYVSGSNVVVGTTDISSPITLDAAAAGCVPSNTAVASITASAAGDVVEILNGQALITMDVSFHGAGGGNVIQVNNNAGLWVFDGTIDGGAATFGGCIEALDDSLVLLSGDVVVEDCSASVAGGGIFVHSGAELVAGSGSVIRNNSAVLRGGGVSVEGGTATISGEVSDNDADYGGGVCVRNDFALGAQGATVTIAGDAQIVENTADLAGGGVFVERWADTAPASTLVLEGSANVWHNDSSGTGGGIHAEGEDVLVSLLEQSSVGINTSANAGGGIFVKEADLQLSGSPVVTTNTAGGPGGGIRAEQLASVIVEDDALVIFNDAEGDGGGISATGFSSVDVLDTVTVSNNTAGGDGGGICMSGSPGSISAAPPTFFDWMVIQQNTATGALGGGVAVKDSSIVFTIEGVDINGNDAPNGDGGGVGVRNAEVTLDRVSFQTNTAHQGGGIAAIAGAVVDIQGDCDAACSFDDCDVMTQNVATAVGGAIHVRGGSSVTGNRMWLTDNDALDGLAVHVDGGASTVALRNFLVDGHRDHSADAIEAEDGDVDIRNSTLADNFRALHYDAAATGLFHRNVTVDNTQANDFDAAITGNCNVAPTAVENPSGSNNETGVPSLGTCWQPTPTTTLVVDECSSGNAVDLLGRARPIGAGFDRGAFERP